MISEIIKTDRIETSDNRVGQLWFFAILFFLISPIFLRSQTLNPPYPRFGITTFSGLTEASLDILKDFDVIAIIPNNEMARKYKMQNPNLILLSSASMGVWDAAHWGKELPEPWYYHDTAGKRFELWSGAYEMNITPYCPKIDLGDGAGPITYQDYAINWVKKNVDFNYYDGTWHDWWWPDPGYNAKMRGDLNQNGIADKDEWGGIDSVSAIWWRNTIAYHEREYKIPGLKYVVIQIGCTGFWPNVNGAVFEDWPIYNGPFKYWYDSYNDSRTNTKEPKIMIFDAAHRFFHLSFPVEPYKNNYRAVRYALGSCLLTSSYFYVDEGNDLGHHGNVHIYDEFEAKGKLGYPRTDGIKLTGKPLASTPYASGVWVRYFDNGVSIVNATGTTQTITASELAANDPVGGSRYYRFQGGQDPDFNNGQEVTASSPIVLWGDSRLANWSDPEVIGDGIMLFRTRKTLITPIIVDNHVNNQTSPGSDPVQYTGGWVLSSDGQYFYAFYTDRNYLEFQPDGFAWTPPGQGENKAKYIPNIGLAGFYEVFEWHGYRGSSPSSYPLSSAVPVRISCAGKDTSLAVNQSVNFGKWNSLGVYPFVKGKTGFVEISNQTNGIVISDAIRFMYHGSQGNLDTTPPLPPQNVRVQKLN
jgi:hypothetical protein